MQSHSNRLISLAAVLLLLLVVGCKDNSPAKVSGKVTFDGKPLPKAMVVFTPADGSRSSVGVTNESGDYTLRFTPSEEGAVVGEHKVEIVTSGEGADGAPEVKDKIPAKYNKETELKETLKSGKQIVNFDLTP